MHLKYGLVAAFVSVACSAQCEVVTWVQGVEVNWSDGVLRGRGVGRASFDSSIARPSRNTAFQLAIRQAELSIKTAVLYLRSQSALYTADGKSASVVAAQALTSFPPQQRLYADGSVHAVFEVPLSAIEVVTPLSQPPIEGDPIVVKVDHQFNPSLGMIFCSDDETLSVPQARITVHSGLSELPNFLRSKSVAVISGRYRAGFRCVELDKSARLGEVWAQLSKTPRLYIVKDGSADGL